MTLCLLADTPPGHDCVPDDGQHHLAILHANTDQLCAWCADTIPVFFDTHFWQTLPYADIIPWEAISINIDLDWLIENKLNAIDVLNKLFDPQKALVMASKVCKPHLHLPLLLTSTHLVDPASLSDNMWAADPRAEAYLPVRG